MKSRILVLSIGSVIFSSILFFSACKKINEATQLGDDLIPAIDNVTTFQAFLPTVTDNKLFNDTTRVQRTDYVAIGHISDLSFGTTHANAYFNISYGSAGSYPFVNKDSVIAVDSVVLSLSYKGAYGDTNSTQTLSVFEISQTSGFRDDTLYKFTEPDFLVGPQLGTKTFSVASLKDTILHVLKHDTTKLANVVRIKLDNQLATRFLSYTTTYGPLGAYYLDTARGGVVGDSILKTLFRGFAVKSDNSTNVLTYFDLADAANTNLVFYFRYKNGGVNDTAAVAFSHLTNGQAEGISRLQGGGWANVLNNSAPDSMIYVQSTPGSYASVKIPALDTFQNSVIHRAELILTRIPSAGDDKFIPPPVLFLDKINNAGDTASLFDLDMNLQVLDAASSGEILASYNTSSFGGALRPDSTYRFNITRYVQHIVTNKNPNRTLRLYAPMRVVLYSENLKTRVFINFPNHVANGRVVLAGGSITNSGWKVRLRVVYSKI